MTETAVLVLTDDELTCIAAANRSPWALPLGPERDNPTVTTSALAGERSLVARGLVGPVDGKYALVAEAFDYLRVGLHTGPDLILFVVDPRFRWVLEGMSIAWYREGDAEVLEARSANGLHHFVKLAPDRVREALRSCVTGAFESDSPDTSQGSALSLCALAPHARRVVRVSQARVSVAATGDAPLVDLDWRDASLDDAVGLLNAV